jgi:hypothetical protein
MSRWQQNLFGHLACIMVIASLGACRGGSDSAESGGEKGSDDKPKDIESCTNDEVGEVDDTGFWVRAYKDCKADYKLHKNGANWDTTCSVAPSATGSDKNIYCTMEANEEDLYFNGFQLQYNAPADMCYYHWFLPYFFENFEIEFGPTGIIPIFIDADGNAGIDNETSGAGAGILDTVYPTTVAGAIAASLEFYIENGEAKCIYDYSSQFDGAPNCCLGSKSIRTRTFDASTNAYSNAVTNDGEWGGNAASCLEGAAIRSPDVAKDADGFPLAELIYTGTNGLNKLFTSHKPIELQGAGTMLLANYFKTSEHSGGVPLPLRSYLATQATLGNHFYRYYEFRCLDRNSDLLARIRLQVRDYDEYAELQKGGAANGDPVGNPDSGFWNFANSGTRPVEPAPFDDHYLNDFFDWKDFEDLYGTSAFPMLLER